MGGLVLRVLLFLLGLGMGVVDVCLWIHVLQVQKDAKVRGLTVEQMRDAYKERVGRLR